MLRERASRPQSSGGRVGGESKRPGGLAAWRAGSLGARQFGGPAVWWPGSLGARQRWLG
jgi:hypothetical protein